MGGPGFPRTQSEHFRAVVAHGTETEVSQATLHTRRSIVQGPTLELRSHIHGVVAITSRWGCYGD